MKTTADPQSRLGNPGRLFCQCDRGDMTVWQSAMYWQLCNVIISLLEPGTASIATANKVQYDQCWTVLERLGYVVWDEKRLKWSGKAVDELRPRVEAVKAGM